MPAKRFNRREYSLRLRDYDAVMSGKSHSNVFPSAFEEHWVLQAEAINRIVDQLPFKNGTTAKLQEDTRLLGRAIDSILNGIAVLLVDPWEGEGPDHDELDNLAELTSDLEKKLHRVGLHVLRYAHVIPELSALAAHLRERAALRRGKLWQKYELFNDMVESLRTSEEYDVYFADESDQERHARETLGLPLGENPGNPIHSRAVHYLCLVFEALTRKTPKGSRSRASDRLDELSMSGECGRFIEAFFREFLLKTPNFAPPVTASTLEAEMRAWVLCTATRRRLGRSAYTRQGTAGVANFSLQTPQGTKPASKGKYEKKSNRAGKRTTVGGDPSAHGR